MGQMQEKVTERKYKEMTIRELRKEAKKLKKEGISPAPLVTIIHEKLALAFSVLYSCSWGLHSGLLRAGARNPSTSE